MADAKADETTEESDDPATEVSGADPEATDTEIGSAHPGDASDDPASEQEVANASSLPVGNPLQYVRGSTAIAVGAILSFVIMAIGGRRRFGMPVACAGILVATFGVLDLLGSFGDRDERVASSVRLRHLGAPLALSAVGALGLFAAVTLAVAGIVPMAASAVVVPAMFLVAVVGVFRTAVRLGVIDDGIALEKRHGFWLVVLATLMYLPMLGSHSLSDPWETHYGEVAREILARDDWISLWWAQDGWFWSKPIFDFWIQAIAMALFGVRYRSGEMLSAVAAGREPWPEWAVRLPIFLLTLTAVYLLYKAVARVVGRRAGLLGGVVLLTMPQWSLLSHQTMTDMPFVATMSAVMALFLLGVHEDSEREVKVYELNIGSLKLRLSAYHLVVGLVVAAALPQILYLFSRNFEIRLSPFTLHGHADSFMSGSPGNCGLPGNEACRSQTPVLRGLSPALEGLIWIQTLGIFLFLNWGERRAQRLYFIAAWFFAALSTMAKGPAGFGLPVLCALVYVVLTRRHRELLRMEITSGLLILLAVAMPWFVAMYVRHGQPFTDRLLFHDMFKRAFTHVHDTNEGDDVSFRFYVWQLGYATFPWSGLVPASLVWWLRRREDETTRADASVFLAMWFFLAFALFTLMLTKFHHYILPAVPPAAMLVGIFLDDALGRTPTAQTKVHFSTLAKGAVALALLVVFGVSVWLTRSSPQGAPASELLRHGALVAMIGTIAVAVTAFALHTLPSEGESSEVSTEDRFASLQAGAVALVAAMLVGIVGRDLAVGADGQPSQIRLLHLFTYNYKRPWPAALDFSKAFWFFLVAAALSIAVIAVVRVRRQAVTALCALAVLFTVWCIDVYFVKISPHFGQRETTLAYYRAAESVPGTLIAYQMNWKGENFYTGNALPAFVSSGKKFQDYILDEKKKGKKTFYFVTEHSRTGTLQNELGAPRIFEKLTGPELDNKFGLVRATFE